jgi:hypothetical protein
MCTQKRSQNIVVGTWHALSSHSLFQGQPKYLTARLIVLDLVFFRLINNGDNSEILKLLWLAKWSCKAYVIAQRTKRNPACRRCLSEHLPLRVGGDFRSLQQRPHQMLRRRKGFLPIGWQLRRLGEPGALPNHPRCRPLSLTDVAAPCLYPRPAATAVLICCRYATLPMRSSRRRPPGSPAPARVAGCIRGRVSPILNPMRLHDPATCSCASCPPALGAVHAHDSSHPVLLNFGRRSPAPP